MAKKITKQSIQTMLKCSGTELLMSYTTQFRNNTIVYTSHFEFNGNHIKHDRNGSAYDAIFTANATYLLVLVQRPTSIQLFDLRNGDIMIARGMEDILSSRVVAVATQNQQGLKPNQQTRRINLILEQKGSYLLKVIQIESKVDNNPKTRHKLLEQGNISSSIIRSEPIFSLCRWNLFILIRKGIMRVCRAANKNDEISIQFAAQGFEKNLANIFNNNEIIGMSQSSKTWAILRGNDLNSRNNSKIELLVFWQHYFSPEINRNMYYRDQSYIKSVTLPCTQQEYKRMWQNNGFYLIQSQSGQLNSHYCHIISEQNGIQMISIKIGDNSNVCPHTLIIDSNQISICQIQNSNQLNRLKISQEQSNLSQQTRASSNIGNTTVQERSQWKKFSDGNGIKKFEPVEEERKNPEAAIIDDANSGKSTAKKTEKVAVENKKIEQIKGLLNSQIVDHFTRIDKQNQRQQTNTEEDVNLEVPDSIQPVISFGQAGPIKAKTSVPPSNTLLVSFGTQQTKSETPDPVLQNKAAQKKEEKLIKAAEVKQVRQHFNHHQCNLTKQLAERQQSFNENYKSLPSKELFSVQKILTKQQLSALINTQKIMFGLEADLKRRSLQQRELENQRCRKMKKWSQIVQKFEKMISLLRVNELPQIDLGLKGKGRKNKQINEQMIAELKRMSERVNLLQKQSNQLLIENQKQLEKYELLQKPLASTKQVLSFLNGRPKQVKMQKCLRIPIQRLIFCEPTQPLITMDPLEI